MLCQLIDDSPAARCIALLERHCPRLMKQGGGALSRSPCQAGERVTDADVERFVEMRRRRLTFGQIAMATNWSEKTVRVWLKKHEEKS